MPGLCYEKLRNMEKRKKIAVILSGCGVYDGSEIHEATLTLLAIVKNGAEYGVFAPDIPQHHVINHLTGDVMKESRNVLVESARIARGKISPLDAFKTSDFDAVILPGGFGAAKNLSTYAFDSIGMKVLPEVEKIIRDMVASGKPLGALCISPVIMAKLLAGVEVTIGCDEETAAAIEKLGARHKCAGKGEVVIDKKFKVVTTPCYMLDADIAEIESGIDKLVKSVLDLV
jgi:enhancing lycopene biosynthesis protein 2